MDDKFELQDIHLDELDKVSLGGLAYNIGNKGAISKDRFIEWVERTTPDTEMRGWAEIMYDSGERQRRIRKGEIEGNPLIAADGYLISECVLANTNLSSRRDYQED